MKNKLKWQIEGKTATPEEILEYIGGKNPATQILELTKEEINFILESIRINLGNYSNIPKVAPPLIEFLAAKYKNFND